MASNDESPKQLTINFGVVMPATAEVKKPNPKKRSFVPISKPLTQSMSELFRAAGFEIDGPSKNQKK